MGGARGYFFDRILAMNCALIVAAVVSFGDYAAGVRAAIRDRIAETLGSAVHVTSVSGVVTAVSRDFFFVQRGREGVKVLSPQSVAPGDLVAVRGAPALECGRVALKAESLRKLGRGPLPAPKPVSMDDLVYADASRSGVNWQRVALAGRVIGRTEGGFALSVESVPVTVMMESLPPEMADCGDSHPKVVVRGVVEQVLDQASLFGGEDEVMGIRLHADRDSGVSIVPDLAYLARRRDSFVRKLLVWSVPALSLALVAFVAAIIRQRRRLFRSRTLMAERKRMADDLHDTIEQHLVGAKMLVQLGRAKEASDVLVRAKSEIRDIVWGLKNDDMMRLKPAEMLRQLAHEENAKGLYRVDTGLDRGLPAQLDASKMRDLSLIVREAVGNAVKHGGARHIAISSDPLADGGWRLRVANDGEPFDPSAVPGAAEGHFGLEGMRERARRIGATVTIEPRKGGMVVKLEVKGR